MSKYTYTVIVEDTETGQRFAYATTKPKYVHECMSLAEVAIEGGSIINMPEGMKNGEVKQVQKV